MLVMNGTENIWPVIQNFTNWDISQNFMYLYPNLVNIVLIDDIPPKTPDY